MQHLLLLILLELLPLNLVHLHPMTSLALEAYAIALLALKQELTGKLIVINAGNIFAAISTLRKGAVPIAASVTAIRRCLVMMSSGHFENGVVGRSAPATTAQMPESAL